MSNEIQFENQTESEPAASFSPVTEEAPAARAEAASREPAQEPAPPPQPTAEVTENDRLVGGLCYLSQVIIPIVLPAIILLSETGRARPFQRYHAVQSLGFLAAAVLYEVAATIVYLVLTAVSAGCLGCILWVLFFLPIIPAVYYAWEAYQGKMFEIPVVTPFMKDQRWL